MEGTHTPGPWSIDKWGHVHTSDGEPVLFDGLSLIMNGPPRDREEATANTRLVAAAPDLLRGCRLAWFAFEDCGQPEAIAIIKAAIAKAKGEPTG